jgi:hypothetical protein
MVGPLALLAAGLAVSGAAISLALGGRSSGGTPNIVVAEEMVDHGDVVVNTPVRSSFTITNTGDGPLQILNVPQVELLEGC